MKRRLEDIMQGMNGTKCLVGKGEGYDAKLSEEEEI